MDKSFPNPIGADVAHQQTNTEHQLELPDWLDPAPRTLAKSPPEVKSLVLAQYEHIFMRVIDSIALGKSLSQILKDDQRDITTTTFTDGSRKTQPVISCLPKRRRCVPSSWLAKSFAG